MFEDILIDDLEMFLKTEILSSIEDTRKGKRELQEQMITNNNVAGVKAVQLNLGLRKLMRLLDEQLTYLHYELGQLNKPAQAVL